MKPATGEPASSSVHLEADLREVSRARRLVAHVASEAGFDEAVVFNITVACSEAVANAIEHANGDGGVQVTISLYPNRLEVQVDGPGKFQPPRSVAERSHRGLGLPLMATLSDHLALYSGPKGGTLVSLTFYRPGASAGGDREGALPPSIQELIAENELTSAITENAPIGIYVLDPELCFRWTNSTYQALLDEPYRSQDLTGVFIGEVIPGAEEAGILNGLREVSQTGRSTIKDEFEFKGHSRGDIWWRRSIVPLFGGKGEPPYDLLVLISEETQRKQAEARLERDKALFRGAADIFEETLSDRSEESLGEVCLEVAQGITQSAIGFVGEIDRDGLLHDLALSNPSWQACSRLDGHGRRMPPGGFNVWGLYGWVILEGKSLIANNPSSHPASIGVPEGHPRVESFLGVPLKRFDATTGIIAVGNREGGYGQEQREMLEALSPIVVEALERKRAEKVLADTERKYRELVTCAPAAIFELDFRRRRLTSVNDAMSAMTGYSRLELLMIDPIDMLATEEDQARLLGRLERWLHGERPERSVEYEIRKKGGDSIHAVFEVTFTTDREGNALGASVIAHDVTEPRRREANAAFLAGITQELGGLADVDEAMNALGEKLGEHFGVSRIVLAEIGDPPEETATVRYEWHVPGLLPTKGVYRVRDFLSETYQAANRAGQISFVSDVAADERISGDLESRHRIRSFINIPLIRDGTWRFALALSDSEPREWRDDEVELLREVMTRVWTRLERARAEQALSASEERLRISLEAAGFGSFEFYPETGKLAWDDQMKRLWGLDLEQDGPSLEEVAKRIHPDDLTLATEAISAACSPEGDGSYDVEFRLAWPDGSVSWRRAKGRAYFGTRPDGSRYPVRLAGVESDITESKLAELALEESRRDLAIELEAAQTLQRLGTRLIGPDGVGSFYDQLLDAAVASLHADFASIHSFHPERGSCGELELLGHRGFSGEAELLWKWVRLESRCTCGSALAARERIVVSDVENSEVFADGDDQATCQREGIRAVQTTPILSRSGELLGAFSTHWREPHTLTASEGRILDAFARQAAELMERKRVEEDLRKSEENYRVLAAENERLYHQQLEIAENLQGALLHIPSALGPLRLGHLYRSATEAARVGGDFYDVFEVKDGKIALLMGDVAGHGIEAARVAGLTKDVIHAFAHQTQRPEQIVRRANSLLLEKSIKGFVSVFLGIFDPDTGTLRYACAGHPETLLRRVSGEIETLGGGAAPLAVYGDIHPKTGETELNKGDLMLLYTDGVTEARRDGDFFGEDRLQAILRRKRISVERLPGRILDQVLAFSGGALRDDLAILAVLVTGRRSEHGARAGTFKQERLLG